MRTLELYFDVVSPYSLLCATALTRYRERWDLNIVWRPVFLAGIFHSVGNQPPATLAARGIYLVRDLGRLSRHYNVPLHVPEDFPANTLRAMRLVTAAPSAAVEKLAFALWQRHWGEGREIKSDDALLGASAAAGLDGAALLSAVDAQATKDALRLATDAAVERGVFGAPSYFTDIDGQSEMYFGADRLPLFAHDIGVRWDGPQPKP